MRGEALVHAMLMLVLVLVLVLEMLLLLRELLLVVMLLLGSLVAPTRVGVVVDSRVTGELVGSGELLAAAGELAGVRLLVGVRADVPGLVLEAVEGVGRQLEQGLRERDLGGERKGRGPGLEAGLGEVSMSLSLSSSRSTIFSPKRVGRMLTR